MRNVGKVDVIVEFGGNPDFPDFDPAMVGWIVGDEVGRLAVLKIELDVGQQAGLIGFDREMVVRLAFGDEVVGERALSQQGIAADVFAADLDGVEQGGGHLDFVGAFDVRCAFYGQSAHFFWV